MLLDFGVGARNVFRTPSAEVISAREQKAAWPIWRFFISLDVRFIGLNYRFHHFYERDVEIKLANFHLVSSFTFSAALGEVKS